MRFSFSCFFGAAALLAGCGSNAATAIAGDSGVNGADGASADGSILDAGNAVTDSSTDAPVDSGPHCLTVGTTAAQCRACCENGYPAGYQLFGQYTVACACQPQYCGPLDGGADAGGDSGAADAATDAATEAGADAGSVTDEGGVYGQGICSPGTCSYTEEPSPACNTCIYDTLGEVSSEGPCASQILAQCFNEDTCLAFFGCVENCPPE
jgi:hypothetical protein